MILTPLLISVAIFAMILLVAHNIVHEQVTKGEIIMEDNFLTLVNNGIVLWKKEGKFMPSEVMNTGYFDHNDNLIIITKVIDKRNNRNVIKYL